MSDIKVLNLDEFAETKRKVTIDGVAHDVQEMNVNYFIKAQKASEEMKNPNITTVDEFEKTIELIQYLVPTVPIETLRGLSMGKLSQLGRFVQGMLDADARAAVANQESQGNVQPATPV